MLRWVIVCSVVVAVAVVLLVSTFTPLLLEIRDIEAPWGSISFTIRNYGLLRDCLTDVKIITPEGIIAKLEEYSRGNENEPFIARWVDSICINGLSEVKLGGTLGEKGQYRYYSIILRTKDGSYINFTNIEKLKMELVFQSGRKIPIETAVTKTVEGNFTGFPSFTINVTAGVK